MAQARVASLALLIVVSSGVALSSARAQSLPLPPLDTSAAIASVGKVDTIEGPYNYQGEGYLLPVLGWKIVENTGGGDTVKFRLCDGKTIQVTATKLVAVRRTCPPGSTVGPWVVFGDKIVPGQDVATIKDKIDLNKWPEPYRDLLADGRFREGAIVGFPTGKNIDFGIVKNSAGQAM